MLLGVKIFWIRLFKVHSSSTLLTKTLLMLEIDHLFYAKYFYLIHLDSPVYLPVIYTLMLASSFCQHP